MKHKACALHEALAIARMKRSALRARRRLHVAKQHFISVSVLMHRTVRFIPPNKKRLAKSKSFLFGGRGWIRTTEAKKQQIYSLTPLATRELSHIKLKMELVDGRILSLKVCRVTW